MEVYFILLLIFLILGYLTVLSIKRRLDSINSPVEFKENESITDVVPTPVVETKTIVTHSEPVAVTAELPVVQEPVGSVEPPVAEVPATPKKSRTKAATSSKPRAPRKSKKTQ